MPQTSECVGEFARIYRRGNTWWVNLQWNGRQIRQSLRTCQIKVARRRAAEVERQQVEGEEHSSFRVLKRVSIAAAIETYIEHLEAEGRAPKTLTKYRGVCRQLLAFADSHDVVDLTAVTHQFLDSYRRFRQRMQMAPKTIYNETALIRQLIRFALTRQMIRNDPLHGLRIKEPKPTPQPCWSPDQVEQILAAAPAHYQPALTLLADTGVRVGEAKWLTWDDVETNLIHIRPKAGWTTKTGNIRVVPLTPRFRQVLHALPRSARWVFTAPPSPRYPAGDHQISERRLLQALKRVLSRLELKGHLHTFRHSFVSAAITAGIPEAIIRQWVGHVDDDILKLYTHIADVQSQSAMRQLSDTLGRHPQGGVI